VFEGEKYNFITGGSVSLIKYVPGRFHRHFDGEPIVPMTIREPYECAIMHEVIHNHDNSISLKEYYTPFAAAVNIIYDPRIAPKPLTGKKEINMMINLLINCDCLDDCEGDGLLLKHTAKPVLYPNHNESRNLDKLKELDDLEQKLFSRLDIKMQKRLLSTSKMKSLFQLLSASDAATEIRKNFEEPNNNSSKITKDMPRLKEKDKIVMQSKHARKKLHRERVVYLRKKNHSDSKCPKNKTIDKPTATNNTGNQEAFQQSEVKSRMIEEWKDQPSGSLTVQTPQHDGDDAIVQADSQISPKRIRQERRDQKPHQERQHQNSTTQMNKDYKGLCTSGHSNITLQRKEGNESIRAPVKHHSYDYDKLLTKMEQHMKHQGFEEDHVIKQMTQTNP
jgi:hypothetical protein